MTAATSPQTRRAGDQPIVRFMRDQTEGHVIDPLMVGVSAFFTLAAIAAAYAALQLGGPPGASLLLLAGVAALALLGVFTFLASDRQAVETPMLDAVVEALDEPAAVAGADGRVVRANAAWEREVGLQRLPRGDAGALLYAAFAAARRGEAAELPLLKDRGGRLSRLGEERFLVRAPAIREAGAGVATGPGGLDGLTTAAPFGAATLDGGDPFTSTMVEANAALAAIAGPEARAGARFADLFDPACLDEARQRLGAKPGGPVEVRLAHDPERAAHLYLGAAGGAPAAWLLDVSGQKSLELQLAQSQKMQAIGQLAGGIAHDFNNLLMAMGMQLGELLTRHPVGDPSYDGLNEIRQHTLRSADLVKSLLAFARQQTTQREVLDLGELITGSETLLRRLLGETTRLECEYGRDLPRVLADKGQLENVVMNLAVNARDALKPQGGGVVRIRTSGLTRDAAIKLGWTAAPAGSFAMIEVSDNGPGIPPHVMAKMFEPFFTTKPQGEGTGLGLATVYGIVTKAEGHIHVESEPGLGAAFRIFLPVAPEPAFDAPAAAKTAPPPKPVRPAPRDLSGVGRILFVEDEDAVRGIAAKLLRRSGYEVLEAADGEAALELAEEHAGEIDLLISDVIMPGMDGPTMLKAARPFLGDIPVMFISGYAESDFSRLLEDNPGVSFLAKPVDIKTLAERVKHELQRA